ncbi:MAG: YggS family pyridoxal phosphate-dependent enzyme [Lysobacterales bacterium]
MNAIGNHLAAIRSAIASAGPDRPVQLLAVSKTQPATAVRALAAQGQRDFGENYVQEAIAKQSELTDPDLCWHLIGPLQSNKCSDAARHFDWIETVDRVKLIPLLARARPAAAAPLNVLIQVKLSAERSKSGCAPEQIDALAEAIVAEPRLRLRGLMTIGTPWPEPERRRDEFARLRRCFCALQARYREIDTLSMGMSDDFALAIAEGATQVRIGSALFGPRSVSADTKL